MEGERNRHRSGFAGLIGRPNVGKSTLLNRLTGEKLSIVSSKPQTTRGRIVGVVSRPTGQVALVDTPGIYQGQTALQHYLLEVSMRALEEVDVVLLVTDAKGRGSFEVDQDERHVLTRLAVLNKPTLLLTNKIDLVKKPLLLPLIDRYRQQFQFAEVLPISAKTGEGLDELISSVLAHLPEGEPIFDAQTLTDQTERALVAEYIREQILHYCFEEVPHVASVRIDEFDESRRELAKALIRIAATITVERESEKAIVIGKGGRMLKAIGTGARKEIERLLAAPVYLSLHVRVEPGWTSNLTATRRILGGEW